MFLLITFREADAKLLSLNVVRRQKPAQVSDISFL
ncbi:MAG: hypothetical protein ACI9ND_002433 [Yoonia sp.]|jgi:hypothetical protein